MADSPIPDPRNVEALGEAVNEVYREMVIAPEVIFPPEDEMPLYEDHFSPAARNALRTIRDFVLNPDRTVRGYGVMLTPSEAGEVLIMAAGVAYAHEIDEHPEKTWVGCEPHTSILAHACRVFLLALEAGR